MGRQRRGEEDFASRLAVELAKFEQGAAWMTGPLSGPSELRHGLAFCSSCTNLVSCSNSALSKKAAAVFVLPNGNQDPGLLAQSHSAPRAIGQFVSALGCGIFVCLYTLFGYK